METLEKYVKRRGGSKLKALTEVYRKAPKGELRLVNPKPPTHIHRVPAKTTIHTMALDKPVIGFNLLTIVLSMPKPIAYASS